LNTEENKEESQKDSIMGNSEEMKLSKIPIITRKENQEKRSLSVVLSGIGEYTEGINNFFILSCFKGIFLGDRK